MTTLSPMTSAEFAAWSADAIPDYARDKVESGAWGQAEALDKARAEHASLLPQGLATPGHHFWTIRAAAGDAGIGALWVAEQQLGGRAAGYVFDVRIAAPHRRQGHARRAFVALEDKARALGLDGISLHVFGHNAAARALYESLGYATTDVTMFKPVRATARQDSVTRGIAPAGSKPNTCA